MTRASDGEHPHRLLGSAAALVVQLPLMLYNNLGRWMAEGSTLSLELALWSRTHRRLSWLELSLGGRVQARSLRAQDHQFDRILTLTRPETPGWRAVAARLLKSG